VRQIVRLSSNPRGSASVWSLPWPLPDVSRRLDDRARSFSASREILIGLTEELGPLGRVAFLGGLGSRTQRLRVLLVSILLPLVEIHIPLGIVGLINPVETWN